MCSNIQVSSHPYFPEFLTGSYMTKSSRLRKDHGFLQIFHQSNKKHTVARDAPSLLQISGYFRWPRATPDAQRGFSGGVGPLTIPPWTLWCERLMGCDFLGSKVVGKNKGDSFRVTLMFFFWSTTWMMFGMVNLMTRLVEFRIFWSILNRTMTTLG